MPGAAVTTKRIEAEGYAAMRTTMTTARSGKTAAKHCRRTPFARTSPRGATMNATSATGNAKRACRLIPTRTPFQAQRELAFSGCQDVPGRVGVLFHDLFPRPLNILGVLFYLGHILDVGLLRG